MSSQRPVVVVGDANVDMLIRLPEDAPEGLPVLEPPELMGGGTGANTAVALARLDVPVQFVGMIGDDAYGHFVIDDFERDGVDTSAMVIDPSVYTPMVLAMIRPDGERMLVIWPPSGGAHIHLRPDHISRDLIQSAAWVHTTGMCLRDAPVRDAILHAMTLAREANIPVSLDLNLRLELWGWANNARATVERAIELSDVVFGAGDEEIAPTAGVTPVEQAARKIANGQRTVVARQGSAGALAVNPAGEVAHAPAFPVEVVDTLGAGDAFDSGFIAARIAGLSLAEALRWGNAVAGLAITQSGARSSPSRSAVEDLLNQD